MSFMKRVMDVVEVIGFDVKSLSDRLDAFISAGNNGGNNGVGELKVITVDSKQDSLSNDKFTDKVNITNTDNTITTTSYIRDFDGVIRNIVTATKPA
jgi:hypothetical protein